MVVSVDIPPKMTTRKNHRKTFQPGTAGKAHLFEDIFDKKSNNKANTNNTAVMGRVSPKFGSHLK